MSTIVHGLLFHYSTAELAEQMRGRADYHDERAKQKEAALPELKSAVETVKANAEAAINDVTKMSKFSNYHFDAGDQVEALENDIRDHKNKALVFRTLAAHLVPDATYELDEGSLRRLEILK